MRVSLCFSVLCEYNDMPPGDDSQTTRVRSARLGFTSLFSLIGHFYPRAFTSSFPFSPEDGFSHDRVHMLPDRWLILPGSAVAAMRRSGGGEGGQTWRTPCCKRTALFPTINLALRFTLLMKWNCPAAQWVPSSAAEVRNSVQVN